MKKLCNTPNYLTLELIRCTATHPRSSIQSAFTTQQQSRFVLSDIFSLFLKSSHLCILLTKYTNHHFENKMQSSKFFWLLKVALPRNTYCKRISNRTPVQEHASVSHPNNPDNENALGVLKTIIPDNLHHLHHSHLNLKTSCPFLGPLLLLHLLLAPLLPTGPQEMRYNISI